MLAEIASGHRDAADVLFLVAAIVLGLAAVLQRADSPAALALAGWCLLAVGWLLL
jgi:hypothetical protein